MESSGNDAVTTAPGRVTALLDAVERGALALACVGLCGMAVVQGWQVFARYVLNASPSWTEPVALLCMSTTMMLGAACGVRAHRHFGFFILVEASSALLRRVLLAFSSLIAAAMGGLLLNWGVLLAAQNLDYPAAGASLPQGATYLPMCVGGVLIMVFALEKLWRPPAPGAER